jgi:ectoine hydroxylase-related dioxygenase (phytanoyl-CoA dioxygenase family)
MFKATPEDVQKYHEDGYLMVPGLFERDEVSLLFDTACEDKRLMEHTQAMDDGAGGKSNLSAWCIAGDDLYGMFARCHRVVDTAESLLGHKVYHYHSKMMLKEPRTGGAWAWHQDYGYWYHYGYLYPDLISCLIAVDKASQENGCLQVLKGSHKMGRIEHKLAGEQAGADMARVEQAFKIFPLVYCEMEPGTALFFHSNLLHASAQNKSPNSRWSLICCYTAQYNIPEHDPIHPGYDHPFEKVPDDAIRKMGKKGIVADPAFLGKAVEVYANR